MLSNVLLPDETAHFYAMDDGLRHPVGNLGSQRYEDVVDGERMRDIVRSLSGADTDVFCRAWEYALPSIYCEALT